MSVKLFSLSSTSECYLNDSLKTMSTHLLTISILCQKAERVRQILNGLKSSLDTAVANLAIRSRPKYRSLNNLKAYHQAFDGLKSTSHLHIKELEKVIKQARSLLTICIRDSVKVLDTVNITGEELGLIFEINYFAKGLINSDLLDKEDRTFFCDTFAKSLHCQGLRAIDNLKISRSCRLAAQVGKTSTLAISAIQELVEKRTLVTFDNTHHNRCLKMPLHKIFIKKFDVSEDSSKRSEVEENTFFSLCHVGVGGSAVVPSHKIRIANMSAMQLSYTRAIAFGSYRLEELPKKFAKELIRSLGDQEKVYWRKVKNKNSVSFLPIHLTRESYEARKLCESFLWQYEDEKKRIRVDFRTMILFSLEEGFCFEMATPLPLPKQTRVPTKMDLSLALQAQWQVLFPELISNIEGTWVPLRDFTVKPHVKIYVLEYLMANGIAGQVLDRLTEDSELILARVGEYQPLDMYSNNFGVRFQNEGYKRYNDTCFVIAHPLETDSLDFDELFVWYISGKINLDTPIELIHIDFADEEHIEKGLLKEFIHLVEVLNSPFEFVLFDGDYSIGEHNGLNRQWRWKNPQHTEGEFQHTVPLRWALLETHLKDKTLSLRTIERLKNSEEHDQQIADWAMRKDSPLKRRLSKTTLDWVQRYLYLFLKKYSLSSFIEQNNFNSIKSLREAFAQELSQSLLIWKEIEKEVAYVSIKGGETVSVIAKKCNLSIEKLLQLNPEISIKGTRDLKKVRRFDLTCQEKEAVERRYRYALQLFPRLTLRQQEALFERQNRRSDYLFTYETFKDLDGEGESFRERLLTYVNNPVMPFSSFHRSEYQKELMRLDLEDIGSQRQLQQIKDAIVHSCRPTLFNLLKVMYPLLADVYALHEAIFRFNPGSYIGNYKAPLEHFIDHVKERFSSTDWRYQTAERIEAKIRETVNPGYFGNWSYRAD